MMSEDASLIADSISFPEAEVLQSEEVSEQTVRPIGFLQRAAQEHSTPEQVERSPSGREGDERRLLENLKRVRERALASRRRAIAEAFAFADQCKALAERLPKAQILAFVRDECRVSRSEANAYLQLTDIAASERAVLEQSATDVGVLLRLVKQPATVQAEALTMLRSGRTLSQADLRSLRRDILAAEARDSREPDRSAIIELKRAVRRKAQGYIDSFLEGLGGLANAFADLHNETTSEDRSPETVARVDALAEDARRLANQLERLVPADLLTSDAGGGDNSWSSVNRTLLLLADRRLCLEEDWSWPEFDPLWIDASLHEPLLWALGQELPESSRHRRRLDDGIVALDPQPQSSRSRPSKPYRYSVLELCAGAGGQAIGLHAAGFWHKGIIEMNSEAAATLRANRPNWPVIEADINTVDVSSFKGVDLIAGGLPCQPYSQAGERRGAADERDLFDRALEIIEQVQPKAVMIENVVGITQITHGLRRLAVYAELERLGYDVDWRVIEGPVFGLGQKRRRAILVAMQRGTMHRFRWPLAPDMVPTTVGTLLREQMGARGWKGLDEWAAKADGLAPTLIGGSAKKLGMDLAQPNSRRAWFDLGVDPNKVEKDAPDPDFAGVPHLTLPMLAQLQDFPADWMFSGRRQAQFRQITNAFPPRMARVMGLAIQRALSGEEIDVKTAIEAPLFTRIDLAEYNRYRREAAE